MEPATSAFENVYDLSSMAFAEDATTVPSCSSEYVYVVVALPERVVVPAE